MGRLMFTSLPSATMINSCLMVSILTSLLISSLSWVQGAHPPIVLVPGFLGSQLHSTQPLNCTFLPATNEIWLNTEVAGCFGPGIDQLPGWIELEYDESTGTYHNVTFNDLHVDLFPPYMNSTKGIEYITTKGSLFNESYYGPLVEVLTNASLGYVRGKDLFGAPYDWRISPQTNTYWKYQFQVLIEGAYQNNTNSPVVIVAHSFGNRYVHNFLLQQSSSWKNKYIKSFISVSAPWYGVPEAVQALVSGADFALHLPDLAKDYLALVERTWEAVYYLAPQPSSFKRSSIPIARDWLGYNYTVLQYEALFNSFTSFSTPLNYTQFVHAQGQDDVHADPGVIVYSIYGTKLETSYTIGFDFFENFDNKTTTYGDGDGLVPLYSATVPEYFNWTSKAFPLPYNSHLGILTNQTFFDKLVGLL
eukprot:TRINITY_DN15986_c0_g1_i2.p1 TRINITY_DN15986_c0_g1~~TRINITY_DN15986_c0_g1_i2.p1  ORF type:complete len:419 (+),score=31.44 TRINITY_DN15986_c0_g1_i2:241-1497(+)